MAVDIAALLGSIIIGKVIFYYIVTLAEKGINYLTAKKDYKEPVQKILTSLSNNDNFIDKVSNMVDTKKGIDSSTADKIVKLPYVQTQIIKMVDSTNGELDENELKNHLKTALVKAWDDRGLTDRAVEKVKKDIK